MITLEILLANKIIENSKKKKRNQNQHVIINITIALSSVNMSLPLVTNPSLVLPASHAPSTSFCPLLSQPGGESCDALGSPAVLTDGPVTDRPLTDGPVTVSAAVGLVVADLPAALVRPSTSFVVVAVVVVIFVCVVVTVGDAVVPVQLLTNIKHNYRRIFTYSITLWR